MLRAAIAAPLPIRRHADYLLMPMPRRRDIARYCHRHYFAVIDDAVAAICRWREGYSRVACRI